MFERLARRTLPMAPLLVCLVLLPACVAGPVAVLGETGPPPPGLAGPLPQVQVLVVDDEGNPVADAAVRFDGTAPVVTGSDGLAAVDWPGRPIEVNAKGPGLRPASAQIESLIEEPLEVTLQPVVLNGRVVTEAGKPITGVEVTLGEQSTSTDDAGRFTLRRATKGELTAWMPAWETARVPWDGRSRRVTVEMSPLMVRGLHVAGWLPANPEVWPGLVDLVERTELNALVVDIKDESGSIFHESDVEVATRARALKPEYDIEELAAELHERNLYLIGRIVAFQDPIAARAIPAMAIRDTDAHEPYNNNGQWFLDPTDENARQYALDLAAEACPGRVRRDPVRLRALSRRLPRQPPIRWTCRRVRPGEHDHCFPRDRRPDTQRDGLRRRRRHLRVHRLDRERWRDRPAPRGVVAGGGRGVPDGLPQPLLDRLVRERLPQRPPHDTVAGALDDGIPRLPATAVLRPWIQDFDGSYACGSTGKTVTQVQSQIEAATERGLGYMVWNAASSFTEDAFRLDE